jgi:hypothetical protein
MSVAKVVRFAVRKLGSTWYADAHHETLAIVLPRCHLYEPKPEGTWGGGTPKNLRECECRTDEPASTLGCPCRAGADDCDPKLECCGKLERSLQGDVGVCTDKTYEASSCFCPWKGDTACAFPGALATCCEGAPHVPAAEQEQCTGGTECCPKIQACNDNAQCCGGGTICTSASKCCPSIQACKGNTECCKDGEICIGGTQCCAPSNLCEGKTKCCAACIDDKCCPEDRLCNSATECCAAGYACAANLHTGAEMCCASGKTCRNAWLGSFGAYEVTACCQGDETCVNDRRAADPNNYASCCGPQPYAQPCGSFCCGPWYAQGTNERIPGICHDVANEVCCYEGGTLCMGTKTDPSTGKLEYKCCDSDSQCITRGVPGGVQVLDCCPKGCQFEGPPRSWFCCCPGEGCWF